MKQITPYLFFKGTCKDAMSFYKECFKGTLEMTTVGQSPAAKEMPTETHDNILHAAIMVDGKMVLMASDTMTPDQKFDMGEGVYNCIICNSKEEITSLYEKLSEGGTVTSPLKEEFFGMFANLTDKFGVKWMLEFDQPKS